MKRSNGIARRPFFVIAFTCEGFPLLPVGVQMSAIVHSPCSRTVPFASGALQSGMSMPRSRHTLDDSGPVIECSTA